MTSEEEMLTICTDYSLLDDCLDKARASSEEQFSIANFIQGRKPPKKKRKTCNLRPIVHVRFNTSLGKPKPVTLKALLDSSGSGKLVTEEFACKF
jgi:hypothetical protein